MESDWVAPERYVEIIDIILVIGFPIYIANYSSAAPEIKLGEIRLFLIVVFGAPIHILPSIFNDNINAIC